MNSVGPASLTQPSIAVPQTPQPQAAAASAGPQSAAAQVAAPAPAQYFSPVMKMDPDTNIAVMVVRDEKSGKVLEQMPSQQVVDEYRRQMHSAEPLPAQSQSQNQNQDPSNGSQQPSDLTAGQKGLSRSPTGASSAEPSLLGDSGSPPLSTGSSVNVGSTGSPQAAADVAQQAAVVAAPPSSSASTSVHVDA